MRLWEVSLTVFGRVSKRVNTLPRNFADYAFTDSSAILTISLNVL